MDISPFISHLSFLYSSQGKLRATRKIIHLSEDSSKITRNVAITKQNKSVIIAIAVLIILATMAAIFIVWWMRRRRRIQQKTSTESSPPVLNLQNPTSSSDSFQRRAFFRGDLHPSSFNLNYFMSVISLRSNSDKKVLQNETDKSEHEMNSNVYLFSTLSFPSLKFFHSRRNNMDDTDDLDQYPQKPRLEHESLQTDMNSLHSLQFMYSNQHLCTSDKSFNDASTNEKEAKFHDIGLEEP